MCKGKRLQHISRFQQSVECALVYSPDKPKLPAAIAKLVIKDEPKKPKAKKALKIEDLDMAEMIKLLKAQGLDVVKS